MYTQSIFCQSPPLLDFVCSSISQVASSTCWSGSDGSEGDSGCEEDAASEHSARLTEAGAEVEPWGAAKQSMLIRSVLRAYPGHRHEQPRTPPPSPGSVFSTDGRQSSSLDQDWGASEFPYREFDSFPAVSHIPRAALIAAHTGMFQPRKVPSGSLSRFQSKAFGRESQGLYAVVSVVA